MADPSPDILRYIDAAQATDLVGRLSPAERDIIERINRKVAAADSLEAVLDLLFGAVREVSACDRISLAFVEEDGRRIISHVTRADYQPILLKKGYAADLAGSSLEAILNEGRVRIINHLDRYLAFKPTSSATRLLIHEGVRSSLTCPLVVEGRRVGVLFRSARQPAAYEDRHAVLQLALAERISQAVEKAYPIEQLTAANRAYFEMLGFVTHELKSPVASMVMDAQLMTDGYLGELQDQQRERLKRLVAKGQYLLSLVNEYLDLARIESGELHPVFRTDVDLVAEIVEPSLEIVGPQIEAKKMRLTRDLPADPPRVQLDPNLIRIVLVNLLSNAGKYGRSEGEVRLRARREEQLLTVSVWNEGPGFPTEQRERLFRKFSRLDDPTLKKEKGTGVGLYTVWRIIHAHGGHVDAASEPGAWAEFRFEIPQPPVINRR